MGAGRNQQLFTKVSSAHWASWHPLNEPLAHAGIRGRRYCASCTGNTARQSSRHGITRSTKPQKLCQPRKAVGNCSSLYSLFNSPSITSAVNSCLRQRLLIHRIHFCNAASLLLEWPSDPPYPMDQLLPRQAGVDETSHPKRITTSPDGGQSLAMCTFAA